MSPISLTPDQQKAFDALQQFVSSNDHDTFILNGYAGTGKTFLMQHLAAFLDEAEIPYKLLATTGRAAAILRGKTGKPAGTVHGELYRFRRVEGLTEDETQPFADVNGQLSLYFSMRKMDDTPMLYVVDEASMLSSRPGADDSSYARFGTGILLEDLCSAVHRNKIVFVGDPCQLPPMEEPFSPALDPDFLASWKRLPTMATLTEIVRTNAENDILVVAGELRKAVAAPKQPMWPRLPARYRKNMTVHASIPHLLEKYLATLLAHGPKHCVAIAHSNAMCFKMTRPLRERLWGMPNAPLMRGDVLMVTQNHRLTPLCNGDFVRVVETMDEHAEAGLRFLRVRVRDMATNTEYETLLSLDVLYGNRQNLTGVQQSALMREFVLKMLRLGVRPNTDAFNDAMARTPYLNSLRATYGYVVTCHKAQGGEWDEVFLFLNGKMFGSITTPRTNILRWWYTAVTRARQHVHLHDDVWVN